MSRARLEVADVIRRHGADYLREFACTPQDGTVLRQLAACRTAELGGHVERCDNCGHERNAYNSCRNRHCPKCLVSGAAHWVAAREEDLLPVHYFHVVFTLPEEIAAIALQNKRVVYDLLFRASSSVLSEVAADPRHLGIRLGFLGVLHTWGQTLVHHPHVHYVIAGGGPSIDGQRWISCYPTFFLPIGVLRKKFRGRFLDLLKRAHESGELSFYGRISALKDRNHFLVYLKTPYRKKWVVYAKPPFGGPKQVFRYLACYTHRVAISNSRLVSLQDGEVTFLWRDYKTGNQIRNMTLHAHDFLHRFLLHVLPKRFVRIRYYGFISNRLRATELEYCRELLNVKRSEEPEDVETGTENDDATDAETLIDASDAGTCPICMKGRMIRTGHLLPRLVTEWPVSNSH